MHNFLQNLHSQHPPSENPLVLTDSEPATTGASWFVYMIETGHNTLYTGIATDIDRRFDEHLQTHLGQSRLGAKYFRAHKPLRVVYREACANKSDAARREYAIKQLSAQAKRRLIQGTTLP